MSIAAFRKLIPRLVLVAAIALANPAYAGSGSESVTSIGLGYFVTDHDTESGLQSTTGEQSDLDFEGDLGLDSSVSAFRFDLKHQFNDRHSIDVSIFDLSRDGDFVIDGEIDYEDTTFPISARVRTELDFTIYKAAYAYNFWRRENWRIGASAGLYVGDIGIALINDDTGEASAGDVTAPLPVFGLRGSRDLGERWRVYAGLEAFVATIDDIDGFIYDAIAGVDFQTSKRTAVSLAWNAVELDIDALDSLNADLNWTYSGALLSFRLEF
jgi:hypothetical protein